MARLVTDDVHVEVNSVDLSEWVRNVRINRTRQEVTSAAMGDEWMDRHTGGVKDGSIEIEFIADFAANAVHATLNPLFGTTTNVKVIPKAGTVSATNPRFDGDVFIGDLDFINATYGELSTFTVTWPFAGAPDIETS